MTEKQTGEINNCYNNDEKGICYFDGKPCKNKKGVKIHIVR